MTSALGVVTLGSSWHVAAHTALKQTMPFAQSHSTPECISPPVEIRVYQPRLRTCNALLSPRQANMSLAVLQCLADATALKGGATASLAAASIGAAAAAASADSGRRCFTLVFVCKLMLSAVLAVLAVAEHSGTSSTAS